MGNTAVICTVHGPAEGRRVDTGGGRTAGAVVVVAVNIAGFSGIDRKKRSAFVSGGGGDRSVYTLLFYSTGVSVLYIDLVAQRPYQVIHFPDRSSCSQNRLMIVNGL
jgi:hypothetical protein